MTTEGEKTDGSAEEKGPKDGSGSSGERRTYVRLPIELWTEEVAGDDLLFRRTGNLSVGGVFFDQAIPHPVGTKLSLRIPLPESGRQVVAEGEVVAVNPGEVGMRVKFNTFEEDGEEALARFLDQALS